MTRWHAGSLALGLTALLSGCAGVIPSDGDLPPASADSGGLEVRRGRHGLVIGAPDADSDLAMSRELARLTGFGLVAVIDGRSSDGDVRSVSAWASARQGVDAYGRRVVAAAQGPLALYVEIRGPAGSARVTGLEVRTVGVSVEDAWRLKTLLELIRDSRLGGASGAPALAITVAPWEGSETRWRAVASAAAPAGRGLSIALPRSARTTYREIYTGILADFLVQSAGVLAPRPR